MSASSDELKSLKLGADGCVAGVSREMLDTVVYEYDEMVRALRTIYSLHDRMSKREQWADDEQWTDALFATAMAAWVILISDYPPPHSVGWDLGRPDKITIAMGEF